jgi:hypothetical protein
MDEFAEIESQVTLAMMTVDSLLDKVGDGIRTYCCRALEKFNAQRGTAWQTVVEETRVALDDRFHDEFTLTIGVIYSNGKRPHDELDEDHEQEALKAIKPFVLEELDRTPYGSFSLTRVRFNKGYFK